MNNPFVLTGYQGPEYFCDRIAETQKLCTAIRNDSNVTLLSPRRYGKTGLIWNSFNQLSKNKEFETIYLDIFGTQNLADFTKSFANAVLGRLDTPFERMSDVAKSLIQSLRPTLSYDSVSNYNNYFILDTKMLFCLNILIFFHFVYNVFNLHTHLTLNSISFQSH